jgi:NTE family protein
VRTLNRKGLEDILLSHPQIALRFNRMIVERTIGQPETPWSDVQSLITVWGGDGVELAVALAPFALKPQPRGQSYVGLLPLAGAPPVIEEQLPHGIVLIEGDQVDEDELAGSLSRQSSIYRHILVVLPAEPSALSERAVAVSEATVSLGEPPAWLRRLQLPERLYITDASSSNLEQLARQLAGQTVGVALSTGGSRGVAHLGVLQTLREATVPIDMIAGVNTGALFGACFAAGWPEARLHQIIVDIRREIRWRNWDVSLRGGLIKGNRFRTLLDRWLEGRHFADLEIPMVMVAVDADTSEMVIFDSGPLADAIRASLSLPGIFAPWHYQGHYCLDGGIINPLPTDVLRDRGIHRVIASNVATLTGTTPRQEVEKLPSFIEIMTNMQFVAESQRLAPLLDLADVKITLPGLPMPHTFDFTHSDEYLQAGQAAAHSQLLEVWRMLGLDQYLLR